MIFKAVSDFLYSMGRKTGLTYKEVNILLYYFIIPFTWICLLDIIYDFHYLKMSFALFTAGFIAGCRNFRAYSDWLFQKSFVFLNYFNRYGGNYISSSVWICVSLPIFIYAILFYLILK